MVAVRQNVDRGSATPARTAWQDQDLQTLQDLTAPRKPLARWRARLIPAIAARSCRHVSAAKRIATRMFVEKPKAFRRRLEAMWETG